jgi:MFS family permease
VKNSGALKQLNLKTESLKNLAILFIVALLFWLSITILLPILPSYIEDIGGKPQQVGLVMGSFAIGLLLTRTWLGNLADQHSRKLVILIGLIITTVAPLLYTLIQSIPGLMLSRAFHGISMAAFTTAYSALIVDLSPPQKRGELLGYMSLAMPIGMALGPAIGGSLQPSIGYSGIFLIAAISGGLSFICSALVTEEKREILENILINSKQTFWHILSRHALFIPTIVLLVVGLVFGTLVAFLPLFVRQNNPELNVGFYYTIAAIATFVSRTFAGKASDDYGRGLFISISLACYGISMIFLTVDQTPIIFIISAIFEGFGGGIFIPLMIALVSDRVRSDERGKAFGICLGGFDLGIAIAGPLLGAFALSLGYKKLFAIAAYISFLGLLIFLTQSNHNLRRSLGFSLGQSQDSYKVKLDEKFRS